MKKLLAILAALILSGCAASNVAITLPDGTKKEANSMAIWTDFKSVKGDFLKETFDVKGMEGNLDLQTLLTILQAASAASR